MLEKFDRNMSVKDYDELLAHMLPLVEEKLDREVTLEDLTRVCIRGGIPPEQKVVVLTTQP